MSVINYVQEAANSRAKFLEATARCFADCGVALARMSIQEYPDESRFCVDGVARASWKLKAA